MKIINGKDIIMKPLFNRYKKILWQIANYKCIKCNGELKFTEEFYKDGKTYNSFFECPTDYLDDCCATQIYYGGTGVSSSRFYKCINCDNKVYISEYGKARYKLGYLDDLSVIYDFREE